MGGNGASLAYGPSGRRMDRWREQNDDTLISVPVLQTTIQSPPAELDNKDREKGLSGFFRRKALNFDSLSSIPVNVTLRQVPQKEYQKHYLKDHRGRYMGTEEPADDCILNEEDTARWRGEGSKAGLGTELVAHGTPQDDTDVSVRVSRIDEGASLPPRPAKVSSGRRSRFGLFKGAKSGGEHGGIVR
jgi:hypothetical protein